MAKNRHDLHDLHDLGAKTCTTLGGDHEIMEIMVKTIPIQKKKFFHKTLEKLHDLHDLHDLRRKMEENDKRHWIVLVREGTYRQRREFRVDAQYCTVTQAGVAWYHENGTLAMFVPHNRIDIVFFPGLVEA